MQEFEAEMNKARAEEALARRKAEAAARQLEHEERQLASLRAAAAELAEGEQRYWHEYNDFHMKYQEHADEHTSISRKV